MPSRFEARFAAAAAPQLQRQFGVAVRFCRGNYVSAEFTARRNDREYQVMGAEWGIELSITMRQFTLPVASVAIDGDLIEPRTGDRITEGSEIFEIQPPDDNKPAVELQTGGYEFIVHTKRVE